MGCNLEAQNLRLDCLFKAFGFCKPPKGHAKNLGLVYTVLFASRLNDGEIVTSGPESYYLPLLLRSLGSVGHR